MIQDIILLSLIIPVNIFSIVKFVLRKGRRKQDVSFMMIPSSACIITLVIGLIIGLNVCLPAMSVSFCTFACTATMQIDSRKKAMILIPTLSMFIALVALGYNVASFMCCAISSACTLTMVFLERFASIPELVKKQALSMLISDWTTALLSLAGILVALVSCSVHEIGGSLGIAVRSILASSSAAIFIFLYIRFLQGHALFLGKTKVRDIENQTLMYVRNDIATNADNSSRDLFQRIHEYVVVKKNYLNPNLSEPEVAREVYVNKAYVGRAILKYTGKNYCTYVGGYRVEHAMDLFEKDPSLRAGQLALQSGFRNEASMNLIFRNITGMTPSEWIAMRRAQMKK